MLILFLPVLIIESLFFLSVTRKRLSPDIPLFSVIIILSIIHTTFLIITFLKIITYNGEFVLNSHLSSYMNLTFLIAAGTFPKLIITIFSAFGRPFKKRFPSISKWLNRTGIIIGATIIMLVISGNIYGRFNFRTHEVKIDIDGLPEELKGLRIVQVSDLHISSFHNHENRLMESADIIRELNPDILVNTGDFVSYGYQELEPYTELINYPESRYGNYAVLGNHDMGTYHPRWTQAERDENVKKITEMVISSGFRILEDENLEVRIGRSIIKIAGITTSGSIPDITYGDFDKAMEGIESTDFCIFLSHDPGFWVNNKERVNDIELTLSGHTHGMQLGLETGRIRISPASLLFPAWGGLYGEKNNYLYVNRGLGTLGFPFRIGMPPEITLLILE